MAPCSKGRDAPATVARTPARRPAVRIRGVVKIPFMTRMGTSYCARPLAELYFSDIVYHIDMADPGLGEFEQLVLLTLARQGPDAYGVSIASDIAERAKRDVSLGAVYKTLERLELKGLVTSALGLRRAMRVDPVTTLRAE